VAWQSVICYYRAKATARGFTTWMTIPRFGTDEQVELTNDTAPLNDIAFKMLDKKVAQPIVRRIGQQHSYTNYRYIIIGGVRSQVENHETDLVNPIFISLLDSIALLRPQLWT